MRLTAIALACLLALAAAPAHAEDELPPTSQFFDEYDTNADGKVLADEFAGSREVFKLLDKNGDGAITPDELGLPADYKPAPRKRAKGGADKAPGGRNRGGMDKRMEQFRKRLQKMDANQDGRVSKDEWQGPEQAFDRMDRNKDGFLDAKDRQQDRAPKGRKGGEGKGRGGSPEQMKKRVTAYFERLDKNADGKLSADEVPNPRMMEGADADKDGSVSLEELMGAMQRRMSQGRKGKGGGREGKGRQRGRGRMSAGMLRRWDRDDDGKVSPDEFPGRAEMFARLDVDKDGFLTEADVKAARERRGGDAPKGKAPATTKKSGNVIEQQDTDGDGRLHRAEFQGPNSVWRLLDRNGDGWITADELQAQPEK